MPLYDFWCEKCAIHREATMPLATLDKYERGKLKKSDMAKFNCPECREPMRKIIAPVRLSSERCTIGC